MGYSAHYLAYGFQLRDTAESVPNSICEITENSQRLEDRQSVHRLLAQNLLHAHEVQNRFYDCKHRQNSYQIGQQELIFNPSLKWGNAKAFSTRYHGPATIVKKLHDYVYEVKVCDEKGNCIIEQVTIQRLETKRLIHPYHEDNHILQEYGFARTRGKTRVDT